MIKSIRRWMHEYCDRDFPGVQWFINRLTDVIVFRDRICRIITYIPVIWSDWNFDYHGTYSLLYKKLSILAKCIREGHYVDCELDADTIDQVCGALKRLIEDNYVSLAVQQVNAEHGLPKDFINFGENKIPSHISAKTYINDLNNAFNTFGELQKIDHDFVFNTIRDNLWKWWD